MNFCESFCNRNKIFFDSQIISFFAFFSRFFFRLFFRDHYWSWDFVFKCFCWKNDSKNLSRSFFFRENRFRSFFRRCCFFCCYIKWNYDVYSWHRKKNSEWTEFFFAKKFEWCRIITLWCFFVVVVIRLFEIKRLKELKFFR